ncbi:DNA replication regulator SLD3-domain-containing protein [Trametes maxima]|nr:DNA replication regulator SLD3-domain-containing protein [Trametes maxima]
MPLQFLPPVLLRVEIGSSSSPSTSQTPPPHPLHLLLKPVLLTSRASSQKYHSRIPQLLADEDDAADAEEEYMWYAYHKDKVADADAQDGQDEHETHERLKAAWLERMERREVQIQILLHFLLLTLPGNGASPFAGAQPDPADAFPLPPPPLSPSKSKKRKRKERVMGHGVPPPAAPPGVGAAPTQPLEERLESYMDKLAMWQLMRSVDSTLGHRAPAVSESAAHGKQKDGRDWMQAFYEDVVEPLFRDRLPELCALFRSKLFLDTAGSDADTVDLTPPTSPKPAPKRLKAAAADGAGPAKTKAKARTKEDAAQRSRSRSLSMSLEQEQRERSRSVSIGPGGLRKRAINREVSMTTVFKGKERAKGKADLARTSSQAGPCLSRTQSQSTVQASTAAKGTKGTVLVAATPSKPRAVHQSQSQTVQTRLPALFGSASQAHTRVTHAEDVIDVDAATEEDAFATPTKVRRRARPSRVVPDAGDTDDAEDAGDEWKLDSSPDVLLLGATGPRGWGTPHTQSPPLSSSPADLGGFAGSHSTDHGGRPQGRVLVGDTPTKAR